MKKNIRLSNGQVLEMTFEEARDQFKPMVISSMNRANNKFIFNPVERDDFMQELEIELWRAYESYDPDSGNCFTTYLFYKLQKGVRNATYSRYSLKNQNGGLISMNAPMREDDLKLEDMFASDDDSMDNIYVDELTAIIRNSVTKEEEDALKVLLDKKSFPVVDYAEKYNITRQAANQRVVKLKKKLQQIVSSQYLETV